MVGTTTIKDIDGTSFDFGFSFTNEEEINDPMKSEVESAVKASERQKLERIKKLIIPLLDSLMKDPDKTFIKWPNREEPLKKLKAKILEIV